MPATARKNNPKLRDAVIVDELIGSNPVERAKRPPRAGPGARHRVDHRAASGLPGHCAAAPACSRASRFTSSQPGLGTRTRPSRSGSMPM